MFLLHIELNSGRILEVKCTLSEVCDLDRMLSREYLTKRVMYDEVRELMVYFTNKSVSCYWVEEIKEED